MAPTPRLNLLAELDTVVGLVYLPKGKYIGIKAIDTTETTSLGLEMGRVRAGGFTG